MPTVREAQHIRNLRGSVGGVWEHFLSSREVDPSFALSKIHAMSAEIDCAEMDLRIVRQAEHTADEEDAPAAVVSPAKPAPRKKPAERARDANPPDSEPAD